MSDVRYIMGRAPGWAGRGLRSQCRSTDQTRSLAFETTGSQEWRWASPCWGGRDGGGRGWHSNEVPKTEEKPLPACTTGPYSQI